MLAMRAAVHPGDPWPCTPGPSSVQLPAAAVNVTVGPTQRGLRRAPPGLHTHSPQSLLLGVR